MNDLDMKRLMEILSKMDKKDLEKGISQVSQILNSTSKDEILKKLNGLK